MTGFRDWAVQVLGEDGGGVLADQFDRAMGLAIDSAVFYGTTPPPLEESVNDPTPPETVTALAALVETVAPHATNQAEALGLLVGRAYGLALADADMAAAVAAEADRIATEAVSHLAAVIDLVPDPPTWAHHQDTVDAARAFLEANAVQSSHSPEQEN